MTQSANDPAPDRPASAPPAADTAPCESEPSAGPAAPSDPPASDPTARLVPVTEAIRYRKRAQAAEQQLGELKQQFEHAQAALAQAEQAITALERRQKVDQLLVQADAVDLEAARLLTELTVERMPQPDVALAVEDLRRHKPYLFRQRAGSAAQAMGARHGHLAHERVADAAHVAGASGDRRDLLCYLRLRRQA